MTGPARRIAGLGALAAICLTLGASFASAQDAPAMFLQPGADPDPAAIHVAPGGSAAPDCGAQDRPCGSIAAALERAGAGAVIRLAAGTYGEHDLTLSRDVILQGAGRDSTIIDAGRKGRVIRIGSKARVRLADLTVTGGRITARPDASESVLGGGILNLGDLMLRNVAVLGNELIGLPGKDGARGADGKGAGARGQAARVVDCGTRRGSCGRGTIGGQGATGPNGSNGQPGTRGGNVWGGGIYSAGRLTVIDSLLAGNRAIGGAGGDGGAGGNGGPGGPGGKSAHIVVFGPHPILLVPANYCIDRPGGRGGNGGHPGHGNHGAAGGRAFGGAIYAGSGEKDAIRIVNTEFIRNAALGGAGGEAGKGGRGGAAGKGGRGGRSGAHCVKWPGTDRSAGPNGTDRRKLRGQPGQTGGPGWSQGGALRAKAKGAAVEMANLVVVQNDATSGGGLSIDGKGIVRHATIVGNRAVQTPAGLEATADAAGAVQIVNSLIWDNHTQKAPPADDPEAVLGAQIHSWGDHPMALKGSCVEGWTAPAGDASGNLPGCADPGLPRLDWAVDFHAPGSALFRPGLGSVLIDAGLAEGQGRDTADLDGDGDREEWLPQDLTGVARLFNYPFRVAGMAPRNTVARPDIGAYEAVVEVEPWPIGQAIAPPAAALVDGRPAGPPEVSPLPARDAFYWDPIEAKFYPVAEYRARPVILSWATPGEAGSATPGPPAFQYGRPDWPDKMTEVAADAPISLEAGPDQPLRFLAQGNINTAQADDSALIAGLSEGEARLLTYIDRTARDLTQGAPRFLAIRGMAARDLAAPGGPCVVGQALTPPGERHPLGWTGAVPDPRARIEAAFDGALYSPIGPGGGPSGRIVPVALTGRQAGPLVVAWYRPGAFGVHWPDDVRGYECTWPEAGLSVSATAPLDLPTSHYGVPRVWHQPDPARPGHLRNSAHAVVAGGGNSPRLHVLRTGAGIGPVLLRYTDPETGSVAHRVVHVGRAEAPGDASPLIAGRRIDPPAPLDVLPGAPCGETEISGPVHRDHEGTLWAVAATQAGNPARIGWYYRVQPGMATDLDGDGTADVAAGDCVPWLADAQGAPRRLAYRIDWPDQPEELRVGQSLDLAGQGAVALLHGQHIAARLLPLGRPLTAPLEAVPPAAKPDRRGRLSALPGTLPDRLRWDAAARRLVLSGARRDGRLLINRLSRAEAAAAAALAPGDAAWSAALDALAQHSRDARLLDNPRLRGEDPILSTGAITGEGFVTLALEDDAASDAPVSMRVLRVACPVHTAPLDMRRGPDLFDPTVSFGYGADFGGETDRLRFEWRRRAFDDPLAAVQPSDPGGGGWRLMAGAADLGAPPAGAAGIGQSAVTIPSSDPGLLEATGVQARYAGFETVCGPAPTPWSGQDIARPDKAAVAALAKGWASLVVERVNAFDIRRSDLSDDAESTAVSMIALAGPRPEGDVVLSAEGAIETGLIEIYATLLRRAAALAHDAGGRRSAGIDAQLGQVAGRLGELYLALADEAAADALDPSVGTDSEMAEDRTRASGLFAFAALVPDMLSEELALLRGRSDLTGPVGRAPVYNRLRWSVDTGSVSDAVYATTYGIARVVTENTGDAPDNLLEHARALYPQGHGDAWGHYLSALAPFHDLMRRPGFDWAAGANLAEGDDGVVSLTASTEEEIFARAALARAELGARIAGLEFRRSYRDTQIDRLLGYPGTNFDRTTGWNLSGWTRRTGQGAWLDWLALNAALPAPACAPPCDAQAPDVARVDRATVPALAQIPAAFERVQLVADRAAAGLTPLGLPRDIVPFGLDIEARTFTKEGHFRQVHDSAVEELTKVRASLDRLERTMRDIRGATQREADRAAQSAEREAEARARLIALYGMPYPEDIGGPGAPYPAGYDGPDIYNYDIVEFDIAEFFGTDFELTQLFGLEVQTVAGLTDLFTDPEAIIEARPLPPIKVTSLMERSLLDLIPSQDGGASDAPDPTGYGIDADKRAAFEAERDRLEEGAAPVLRYTYAPELGTFLKPQRNGRRKAYGELQHARLAFLREFAQLRQQVQEYDDLRPTIIGQLDRLEAKIRGQEGELATQQRTLRQVRALQQGMLTAEAVQTRAENVAQTASEVTQLMAQPFGSLAVAGTAGAALSREVASSAQLRRSRLQSEREQAELIGQLQIMAGESREYDQLVEASGLFETAQRQRILRESLRQQDLAVREAEMRYLSLLAEAEREMNALVRHRRETAAATRADRYAQGVNRFLQSEAAADYAALFDHAARHVYLAAKAYQYETGGYGFESGFETVLADILRQRALGEFDRMGQPVSGDENGLVGMLGQLRDMFQSFEYNSDFRNATNTMLRLSVRDGLLRFPGVVMDDAAQADLDRYLDGVEDETERAYLTDDFRVTLEREQRADHWRAALSNARYADLRDIPAFRRCCLRQGGASDAPVPGLALTFRTQDAPRLNLFGNPRQGADPVVPLNAFAHRIAGTAVVFKDYPAGRLGEAPQVFLLPVGADITRRADNPSTRVAWQVFDARLPPVQAVSGAQFGMDLGASAQRSMTSMRASISDGDFRSASEMNTRLLGRSLENERWLLVIPGDAMAVNGDADRGLDILLGADGPPIRDIEIWFNIYSYSSGG